MAATVTVLCKLFVRLYTFRDLVGKAFKGIDVREHGSGNAGTPIHFVS